MSPPGIWRSAGSSVARSAPHDFDAGSGLLAVQQLAPVIYGMTCIGLHAPADVDFVFGDEAIVHYDRAGPGHTAEWLFSRKAETILPLSSNFCLLFRPGRANYQQTTIDEASAMYISLRSAAAWRNYYGRSEAVVESVRRVIKVRPDVYERLKAVPGPAYLAHRHEGELVPHRVDVLKPSNSVAISRPRRRSDRRRTQ